MWFDVGTQPQAVTGHQDTNKLHLSRLCPLLPISFLALSLSQPFHVVNLQARPGTAAVRSYTSLPQCWRMAAMQTVPARLNRKRHRSEYSMIRHILPEPRPLGMFSRRRSPPSCLDSLSSVRLRRRIRHHDIHCRMLEPRQHRHIVPPALAFNHALLAGQGPVPRHRRRLAAAVSWLACITEPCSSP